MSAEHLNWSTPDELRFIDSLSFSGYQGYKQSIELRKNWGKINKSRVLKGLGLC